MGLKLIDDATHRAMATILGVKYKSARNEFNIKEKI
jgi:hypothetical protein